MENAKNEAKVPKRKKYDDQAFQRDLENFGNPYSADGQGRNYSDEVDVKQIIRTALQVEDESRQMKNRHLGGKNRDHDSLYPQIQPRQKP